MGLAISFATGFIVRNGKGRITTALGNGTAKPVTQEQSSFATG